MGHYYYVVNETRREFIDPGSFGECRKVGPGRLTWIGVAVLVQSERWRRGDTIGTVDDEGGFEFLSTCREIKFSLCTRCKGDARRRMAKAIDSTVMSCGLCGGTGFLLGGG